MQSIVLPGPADFDAWRERARALLRDEVPPSEVAWTVAGEAADLFANEATPPRHLRVSSRRTSASSDSASETIARASSRRTPGSSASEPRVPAGFVELARYVVAHSDPRRFALLYRVLWRLTHGEPKLLEHITDDDVRTLHEHAKSVRRDLHKMKAFVRFREVAADDGDKVFVSWFEPEHYIVELVSGFFVRRFTGMRFSILTPYRSMHWDGKELTFGDGTAPTPELRAAGLGGEAVDGVPAAGDEMARIWQTYYASIFNPARLNVRMMRQEMPQKYWKNLPEARLIPQLVAQAGDRVEAMARTAPTTPRKKFAAPAPRAAVESPGIVLPGATIAQLRTQARGCTACPLYEPATQTVFGEGPDDARLVFIGEQPGDQEDLAGRPFVGPAGKLFDKALAEVGIERDRVYVTNTVKHFKFTPRGKFRLHARANAMEQAACRRWLTAELETIDPPLIVALGAMAAQAVFGRSFKLMAERGEWRELVPGRRAIATVHPSYLLRLPDADERARAYDEFVADLKKVKRAFAKA